MKQVKLVTVFMAVISAASLGACVDSQEAEDPVSDDERGGCRNCENGFTYELPSAGKNDLQAGFNHAQGQAKGSCQLPSPQSYADRIIACSSWGGVVSVDGFEIWQASFSFLTTQTSCPSGAVQTYLTRYNTALNRCEYFAPNNRPSGGDQLYAKCATLNAPQTQVIDWTCQSDREH